MKKIAVINDLSGFGRCSLTVAIPIISVLGCEANPVPTAVLTNQTGYDEYYSADMTSILPEYIKMWKKFDKTFDGIYSGYVSNESQVDFISQFISEFRKSYTKVIVDPVMADNGRLYSAYNSTVCKKICELTKTADIITPNFTEFCILTDNDYDKLKNDSENLLERISELAHAHACKNKQSIVVTGIEQDENIYNGIFSENENKFIKVKKHSAGFSGTGDIMASIISGAVIKDCSLEKAVRIAVDFIENAVVDTIKQPYNRNDGINFQKYLHKLGEEILGE